MGNGTPLGRVRALGAAKEGTHHWWRQRLTAGSNLVLMLWFLASIVSLPAHDHATVVAHKPDLGGRRRESEPMRPTSAAKGEGRQFNIGKGLGGSAVRV